MLNPNDYPDNLESLVERLAFAISLAPTKRALAQHCDVSDQAITGWQKKGAISKGNLVLVAAFCGVSLTWILTGIKPGKSTRDSDSEAVFEGLPALSRDNLLAARATIDGLLKLPDSK